MRFLLLCFIFVFSFSIKTQATCSDEDKVPGKLLVVTDGEISIAQGLSSKSGNIWKKISSKKNTLNSLSLNSKTVSSNSSVIYSVEGVRQDDLEKLDYVKSVQSDCYVDIQSNDSLFNFQSWYLSQVGFSNDSITPKREIVVAISDTGFDTNHRDLRDNLWINEAELNGQAGVDDDGNGFVDDIHGYDFADDDSNLQPSLSRDTDHGTHVAGLVSARFNNSEGITGISKNSVKLMMLKGFASNRNTTLGDLLQTIYYAVDNGAHIINASWGVEKTPQGAEVAAINYAVERGVVVVAAAGNSAVPASWVVPANIKNVITVGSLNSQDQLSTFSNYEDSNNIIDFVAPGGDGSQRRNEAVISTGYDGTYVSLRGTSMAAPIVSGALGFLMSQSNSLTAFQAVFILSNSSDNLSLAPYLQSNTETYQKINLENALDYLIANESDLPQINPEIDPVSGFGSRDLASSSSSGGCSGSLEPSSGSIDIAKIPLIIFLLFPLITAILFRKKQG